MYQFRFPQSDEDFLQIRNIESLREKLRVCAANINLKLQLFKLSQPKQSYIYGKCSKCDAKFKYQKDGDLYRLAIFRNAHNHTKFKVSENNLIKQYIRNLPLNIKLQTIKEMTKERFGITNNKFYYLNRSVNSEKNNFCQLIEKLDGLSYQSRYSPYPLLPHIIPNLLITSSPTMRQNFRDYGQMMAVDVTYNLIKEKVNGVGWGIILFLGLNAHNHIVPFAFGMLNDESEETFSSLFLSLFEMLGREPETIISDQQPSIKSSLRKLKQDGSFSGYHLNDNFHILKNLGRKLKNKKVYDLLYSALFVEDKLQFKRCIQSAELEIQNQTQGKLVRQFVAKAELIALSYAPPTFIGHSINTSFIQKANDIVKSYLEYEVPALACFSKLLKIMNIFESKSSQYRLCRTPFESIFQDKQLKLLRFSLSEKTFMHFIRFYTKALELLPIQKDEQQWVFGQHQNGQYCQVHLHQSRFICSCEMNTKTGMPCVHEIYFIRKYHHQFTEYFHKRWFLFPIQEMVETKPRLQVSRGRPRFSRRNLL